MNILKLSKLCLMIPRGCLLSGTWPIGCQRTYEIRGKLLKGHAEQAYGVLSSISHPRARALRLAFDFDNNRPRIGPGYNEPLFVFTSLYILVGAISIAGFLVRLVSDESKEPLMAQMQWANDYLKHLRGRAETI